MENPEVVIVESSNNNNNNENQQFQHSHIGKGKRTKRLRPQSPISFIIPSSSSEIPDSDLDDSIHGDGDVDVDSDDHDMANCLILLAQGPRKFLKQDDESVYRFTSRRFLEAAEGDRNGKGGYYVYECKTCGRNFSSFQALGGHRASHKKPRSAMAMELKNSVSSSISLQLSNRPGYGNNKVHKCSVCGAEFTSGQALGGHMRRHRAVPMSASTSLSLAPMILAAEERKEAKSVICLDLNLNLPVPEEECREKQQTSPVVFPATTLVDCLN